MAHEYQNLSCLAKESILVPWTRSSIRLLQDARQHSCLCQSTERLLRLAEVNDASAVTWSANVVNPVSAGGASGVIISDCLLSPP